MLTRAEKSIIKSLMQSPTWPVLKALRQELCDKIAYEPKTRENEWETLKAVLGMEGQIYGINKFFQELDNAALNANEDVKA